MESIEFIIKNFFAFTHQTITNMGYSLGEGLYEEYQFKVPTPKIQYFNLK